MDVDVRRRPLVTPQGLMDHDASVGQREPLPGLSRGQQQRSLGAASVNVPLAHHHQLQRLQERRS